VKRWLRLDDGRDITLLLKVNVNLFRAILRDGRIDCLVARNPQNSIAITRCMWPAAWLHLGNCQWRRHASGPCLRLAGGAAAGLSRTT
jgi:hypothetical protein